MNFFLKSRQIIIIVMCFLSVNHLFSQVIIKSPQTENIGEDGFSSKFSVYEDKMVISALRAETNFGKTGAVYVYKKDKGDWNLEQEIFPFDGKESDSFGFEVQIFKNTIIVSSTKNNKKGAVYVYRFLNSKWILDEKITIQTPNNYDFGYRLSLLDENNFVVTTFEDSQNGKSTAYVYEYKDKQWKEIQVINTSFNAFNGYNVAHNNDNLFISDRRYPNSNDFNGIVYVFKKVNGLWTEIQKLIPDSGRTIGSGFGFDLDATNEYLAVSSFDRGAYIYKKNIATGFYELETKIEKNSSDQNDYFGSSIFIKNNYVLIGGSKVLLYEKTNGLWKQKKLFSTETTGLSYGFWDVEIHNDEVFISAPDDDLDNNYETNSGLYIYNLKSVLNTPKDKKAQLTISPNPLTNNKTRITLNSNVKIIEKRIYDMNGKLVFKEKNDNNILKTPSLGKGVYFIKILDFNKNFSVKKLIVN